MLGPWRLWALTLNQCQPGLLVTHTPDADAERSYFFCKTDVGSNFGTIV